MNADGRPARSALGIDSMSARNHSPLPLRERGKGVRGRRWPSRALPSIVSTRSLMPRMALGCTRDILGQDVRGRADRACWSGGAQWPPHPLSPLPQGRAIAFDVVAVSPRACARGAAEDAKIVVGAACGRPSTRCTMFPNANPVCPPHSRSQAASIRSLCASAAPREKTFAPRHKPQMRLPCPQGERGFLPPRRDRFEWADGCVVFICVHLRFHCFLTRDSPALPA
jgi:hypothetical protein